MPFRRRTAPALQKKTKKPGHRSKEGRNGVIEETKKLEDKTITMHLEGNNHPGEETCTTDFVKFVSIRHKSLAFGKISE